MFSQRNIRKEVAQACRFLAVHRMLDLWGHVSTRVHESRLVAVTPRFGEGCLPRTVTEDDVLIVDSQGNVVDGRGQPPAQLALDLALYAKQPDVGACIFGALRVAMAFGIARRSLRPFVHSKATLTARIGWLDHDGLLLDGRVGVGAVRAFDGNVACHQPGVGLWAVGADLVDALINTYMTEYHAQANYVAAAFDEVRSMSPAEIQALEAEGSGAHFPGMTANDLYAGLFGDLAPGPLEHPWVRYSRERPPANPVEELKAKLAFTCQVLWHQGTLVTFLEHVSHRIPDTKLWLMTTVRAFSLMAPEDIATLDKEANWIAGPLPPPFKRFHRDIFAARPDVAAIVHTHDIVGRVHAMAGAEAPAIFRNGLAFAGRALPCYAKPSLVFSEESRRGTVAALGGGAVVHELTHGTDFVAATLEEAAVNAIQREELLAMHHLALRLGKPQPMGQKTVADVLRVGPGPRDWWWYYGGEVGDRARSAGGIERAV